MIAVVASLILLFYVLIPSAIFRFVASFSLHIKKFHKTKAQDFTFAVSSCIIPFGLAIILVWYVVPSPFSTVNETLAQRKLAYRTFFVSMYSDKELEQALRPVSIQPVPPTPPYFWSSIDSVLKRQGRFLVWYYLFVIIEGRYVGWLATQYRSGRKKWRDRLAVLVLPPIISEWYVILEAFGSPPAERAIMVDIMSSEGTLYQGKLKNYFFNVEGELSGILLSQASRFEHEEFADHRRADLQTAASKTIFKTAPLFTQDRGQYWKAIIGSDVFFIPRERISNINVRHVTKNVRQATTERFAERKIDIKDLIISEKLDNIDS
jgi:hypothetical protein